jgi:hypothetical protein
VSLRYKHPGEDTIRDMVYAQCARDGIKNPKARDALVEQKIAEWRPVLEENRNFHGEPLRDLYRARAMPAPGPELEAANRAALVPVRVPIFRTLAQACELANREDAHLKAHQPELRRQLAKGGGSSVTVTRGLMGEQLEREAFGAARSGLQGTADSPAQADRAAAVPAALNPEPLKPARLRVR